MALRPDVAARAGYRRSHRARAGNLRISRPPLGPALVPGLWLRARLRLAFERGDDDSVWRAQGGPVEEGGRARPVRRRRKGKGVEKDTARAREFRRAPRDGWRPARIQQPDGREGRFGRCAGWVRHLPPQLLPHARRRMGSGAAGHARRRRHRPALPLAWIEREGFRE